MPNAATRLHDLIVVAQEPGLPVSQAWALCLDAPVDTAEFVRRYAEVLALLSDTMKIVDSLPLPSQGRYDAYAKAWLDLLVSPDSAWTSNGVHRNESALHLLGALGMWQKVTYGGRPWCLRARRTSRT